MSALPYSFRASIISFSFIPARSVLLFPTLRLLLISIKSLFFCFGQERFCSPISIPDIVLIFSDLSILTKTTSHKGYKLEV